MCSTSPVRTPKLELAAKQPSTGECWIPQKKKKKQKTLCPRAKEKPQQECRRGKIMFRLKPHTHSSIFAWRTPWTVEPGRLPSMALQSQT